MLIYEVNLVVQDDVSEAYITWLKDHIEQILRIDGFVYATLAEEESAEAGTRRYVVHYYSRDRESLENYFTHHASSMRQDGLARFPGKFTATRRVLDIMGEFETT